MVRFSMLLINRRPNRLSASNLVRISRYAKRVDCTSCGGLVVSHSCSFGRSNLFWCHNTVTVTIYNFTPHFLLASGTEVLITEGLILSFNYIFQKYYSTVTSCAVTTYQDVVLCDKIKCCLLNCGWCNAVFTKSRLTLELISTQR